MEEIKKTFTQEANELISDLKAGRKPFYHAIILANVHSTSEYGNAITIDQFRSMIDYAIATGLLWVPSNIKILIPALELQYTAAKNSQTAVNTAKAVYTPVANSRATTFEGIDALALGAKGLFYASGTTKLAKGGLEAAYRKLTGARKVAKVKNPLPDTPKNISVSQLSYVSKADNFDKFISILENNPMYLPNEAEYTTIALRAIWANLVLKNNLVGAAIVPYNAAMDLRNKLLYKDEVGVCDVITKWMKPYFLAIYRNDKPKYREINHIRIKKLKYEE